MRLIDGATATAKAYGFQNGVVEERNVLVFDLGGGTLNVSIVNIDIEGPWYEVKSTSGDQHLGGEDFVSCLTGHFVAELKRKQLKDISTDQHAVNKLRGACECAINQLSYSTEARYIYACLHTKIFALIIIGIAGKI